MNVDSDDFNNAHFEIQTETKAKRASDTFGAVLYGTKLMYESSTALLDLHIDVDRNQLITAIITHIETAHVGQKVRNVLIGHEHGTTNNKCHFQTIIWLEKKAYIIIKPATIQVTPALTLLFMTQRARNPQALANYCKKDGDFTYFKPELVPKYVYSKLKSGENKVNAFATIVSNSDIMTANEKMDLLMTHEPRTAITMYKNIEYALKQTEVSQVPAHEWTYPTHLLGRYPIIEQWFFKWALPDGLLRRKALLLYSTKRALGKTQFATRLLNDPSYVVTFRNTFSQGFVESKDPKLVILDDMNCYTKENKETWKALVAGEPTAIRDAYMNYTWCHRVPCIITTNNAFLVHQLMSSDAFNTQVDMIEITDYMGPEGTCPVGMDQKGAMEFTQATLDIISKFAVKDAFTFLGKKQDTHAKPNMNDAKRNATLEDDLRIEKQLNGGLRNEIRILKETNGQLLKEISSLKFNTK